MEGILKNPATPAGGPCSRSFPGCIPSCKPKNVTKNTNRTPQSHHVHSQFSKTNAESQEDPARYQQTKAYKRLKPVFFKGNGLLPNATRFDRPPRGPRRPWKLNVEEVMMLGQSGFHRWLDALCAFENNPDKTNFDPDNVYEAAGIGDERESPGRHTIAEEAEKIRAEWVKSGLLGDKGHDLRSGSFEGEDGDVTGQNEDGGGEKDGNLQHDDLRKNGDEEHGTKNEEVDGGAQEGIQGAEGHELRYLEEMCEDGFRTEGRWRETFHERLERCLTYANYEYKTEPQDGRRYAAVDLDSKRQASA